MGTAWQWKEPKEKGIVWESRAGAQGAPGHESSEVVVEGRGRVLGALDHQMKGAGLRAAVRC